jgi:hypothetical protein
MEELAKAADSHEAAYAQIKNKENCFLKSRPKIIKHKLAETGKGTATETSMILLPLMLP